MFPFAVERTIIAIKRTTGDDCEGTQYFEDMVLSSLPSESCIIMYDDQC